METVSSPAVARRQACTSSRCCFCTACFARRRRRRSIRSHPMSPLWIRSTSTPPIASPRCCSENGGSLKSMTAARGILAGQMPQRRTCRQSRCTIVSVTAGRWRPSGGVPASSTLSASPASCPPSQSSRSSHRRCRRTEGLGADLRPARECRAQSVVHGEVGRQQAITWNRARARARYAPRWHRYE
jgi:hypothetical protein